MTDGSAAREIGAFLSFLSIHVIDEDDLCQKNRRQVRIDGARSVHPIAGTASVGLGWWRRFRIYIDPYCRPRETTKVTTSLLTMSHRKTDSAAGSDSTFDHNLGNEMLLLAKQNKSDIDQAHDMPMPRAWVNHRSEASLANHSIQHPRALKASVRPSVGRGRAETNSNSDARSPEYRCRVDRTYSAHFDGDDDARPSAKRLRAGISPSYFPPSIDSLRDTRQRKSSTEIRPGSGSSWVDCRYVGDGSLDPRALSRDEPTLIFSLTLPAGTSGVEGTTTDVHGYVWGLDEGLLQHIRIDDTVQRIAASTEMTDVADVKIQDVTDDLCHASRSHRRPYIPYTSWRTIG